MKKNLSNYNWVFGYGSLMWRPGFEYELSMRARLFGARRSLCDYSFIDRGTPKCPGLVMGLDKGGSCSGVAFAVRKENWQGTIDYLREREQVTMVYLEAERQIHLENQQAVKATTYLVDPLHEQYAGNLPARKQLEFVKQGIGKSGANKEYVINTHAQLEMQGTPDPMLSWLTQQLNRNANS